MPNDIIFLYLLLLISISKVGYTIIIKSKLYRGGSYVVAILILFPVSFILSSCDLYDELFRNPYIQTIAPNIEISEQWTELVVSPPLKAINAEQSVNIYFPGTRNWDMKTDSQWYQSLFTPDGKPITIEVQIVSSAGTTYPMKAISLGGGVGFSYRGEDPPPSSINSPYPRLPKNMEFTKVRIRANRPIHGGEVKWVCRTGK